MNKLTTMVLAGTFFLSGFVLIAPTQAKAACYIDGNTQYCTTNNARHNRYVQQTQYTYRDNVRRGTYTQDFRIAQLEAYVAQLVALIEQLKELQGNTYYPPSYNNGRSDVDVTTRSATNINDDDATLRGEVDFNGEDEATVYFQYGRSSSALNYETTHFVLDEDDDDEDFKHIITDLREDTKYYFRAVAEDESGDEDYGKILSFTSDDDGSSSEDDYPEIDLEDARSITDNSAKLEGEVEMNDFKNGTVFFVYGEDEDQIDDIEDDYDTYSEVDEDGDDLQKIKVDSDLDNDAEYTASFSGLNDDTDIYFTLCVEFEDEDDDDRIVCAKTEDFTTDED